MKLQFQGVIGKVMAAVAWLALPVYMSADCVAPAALQAKLKSKTKAAAYEEIGRWFGARKQFACAAEAFQNAISLRPQSPQLLYLLGISQYESGQATEAIAPLQQSVRLDPTLLQPHLMLGAALDRLQQTQDAEAEWKAALALDPGSATALDGLVRDLVAEKDFAAVIAVLSGSPVPPTAERSVELARAYSQTGRLDEASQTLHAVYRSDPTSLPVASALAGVLVMQSRKQEAEEILLASMKQHPAETAVRTLYLRMLVMDDESDKARQLGEELLVSASQNWEVQYLNGVLERRAGKFLQARDHLEEAVMLNPQNVECRENLGGVLARLKDAPGAKVQLEKAIALGSRDPGVRFELATVLRTLGENDAAASQLKLYKQEAQAKSDLTQAGAKAAFGDEKLAAGNPLEAAKLYREALIYAPREAALAYKLAMALDKAGDFSGEKAALDQAIAIDPALAEAQNQLGYLASRAGETATAEQHFRQAVTASPRYVRAWINLGAILLIESKWPEANAAVGEALRLEPGNQQAQKLNHKLTAMQSEQQPAH